MVARFSMITTFAISLHITSSRSLPSLPLRDSSSLLPRAEADCFATSFGINDFRSFSGGDTEPAYVSFKTGIQGLNEGLLCSRLGEVGSKSPYFDTPVPCNKTTLPTIFFSYPEDRWLRVYQVTTCGTVE